VDEGRLDQIIEKFSKELQEDIFAFTDGTIGKKYDILVDTVD
jgi:hypothetical protein